MRGHGFNRGICKPVPGQLTKVGSKRVRGGSLASRTLHFPRGPWMARLAGWVRTARPGYQPASAVREGRELHGASSANAAHGRLCAWPCCSLQRLVKCAREHCRIPSVRNLSAQRVVIHRACLFVGPGVRSFRLEPSLLRIWGTEAPRRINGLYIWLSHSKAENWQFFF